MKKKLSLLFIITLIFAACTQKDKEADRKAEELFRTGIIKELPGIKWGLNKHTVQQLLQGRLTMEIPVTGINNEEIGKVLFYEGKMFDFNYIANFHFLKDSLHSINMDLKLTTKNIGEAVKEYNRVKEILTTNFGNPYTTDEQKMAKEQLENLKKTDPEVPDSRVLYTRWHTKKITASLVLTIINDTPIVLSLAYFLPLPVNPEIKESTL